MKILFEKSNVYTEYLRSSFLILISLTGFGINDSIINSISAQVNMDINGDGQVNILILGTNNSINGTDTFSPNLIASELQNILSEDLNNSIDVNVISEDIHLTKPVTLGLGGSGTEFTWQHYSHSLMQYYYWPEGREQRLNKLSGLGDYDWDYVVIGADPFFVSTLPGYYSLGVNKIAEKVSEGEAIPLLLMMWSKNPFTGASFEHFEEYTYRTSDGVEVDLQTIPAGLAWRSLPDDKKDFSNLHPTPNGAYLTAASVYSLITKQSASMSGYVYDDEIAEIALTTVTESESNVHYSGIRTFMSPFKSCDIGDETINYNHTGSSSENGIKTALNWVFDKSPKTLQNGGTPPIDFNYGRANTNFEANKRYKIDPSQFDQSFGFPMQDHGNHGNTSMLYGLDKRQSGTINDTDIGVAQFMVEQSELPYARAIPIRTLYAQMQDAIPGQSAYRDSWHMHRNLDKAVAAYMYTLLNGTCVLAEEPEDQSSDEWATWMSHKIGHETAWNLMYLEAVLPDCSTLLDEDGDGFNSYIDCDDENELLNPNQIEVVYNGIDDDCNPATLDDDLDQDGFLAVDDCDDTNAGINPNAEEIPNNGIDEDCDGSDIISNTHEFANAEVLIYPNPVRDIINIDVNKKLDYEVKLYDSYGKLLYSRINSKNLNVQDLQAGYYFIEIIDINSQLKLVEKLVISD